MADIYEAGRIALGTGATAPGYLPWRSEAAHVHVALGIARPASASCARSWRWRAPSAGRARWG